VVTEGDHQVASHVGLHLLGDLADRAGLTSAYSTALPWTGERAPGQDRGRLLAQVAVTLAGGGVCVSDVAALRDQPDLFGEVASSATIWRAVHQVDDKSLEALRAARATARAKVWNTFGAPEETTLDIDAALIEIHSANKESAAAHYKGGYGFHPMLCFADATGEALAGILRPGNAAANSGADQLELARAEPKALRYRLLHAAARIVRQARRIILRLPEHWPWAAELASAYRRLALLGI